MWQYIIRIFLIFTVGGVASITYFDALSPSHIVGEHPFHITIFETPHPHRPLPQPTEQLIKIIQHTPHTFDQGKITFLEISTSIANSSHHDFQTGGSLSYLLAKIGINHKIDYPLIGWVHSVPLNRTTVWLPPPDKPPSLL